MQSGHNRRTRSVVKLQHPKKRLFTNCILTNPTWRADYSITSTKSAGILGLFQKLENTKIFELSTSASRANTPACAADNEASFFDAGSATYREVEHARNKRVVADISWGRRFRDTQVEIPNRGRGRSAVVGPMRRTIGDLMSKDRFRYISVFLRKAVGS